MSQEDLDFDLLAAFKARFGLNNAAVDAPPDTKVLSSAQYVYDNAIDVSLSMSGTKAAAASIWETFQRKPYSTKSWSDHALHPKNKDAAAVHFIFTVDLLNFSFWSDKPAGEAFAIEYRDKRWTGYWSLVAAIQRALEEGIAITSSDFWQDEEECTEELLQHVFRSATAETMPMLKERIACLREAGRVLYEKHNCSFVNCINKADGSAAALVNLLANDFPCFRDELEWEDRKLRFLKRAQILVADLWACFDGESFGRFSDIDILTIFPDYRIPQILYTMNVLSFSPPLENCIKQKRVIESGHSWEVQIRGCSIWAVHLILRHIKELHPEANLNAVLVDFFLYDTMKELEAAGEDTIPHHRTRSIWY